MDDPLVLLTPLELQSGSDPRLIDTIFNVSSLTSGIFNNSLFQYAGAIIVGIILFGRYISYNFWTRHIFIAISLSNQNSINHQSHRKLFDMYYH